MPPYTTFTLLQHFLTLHHATLRYVPLWRSWLFWDGRRWQHDDSNHISYCAKTTIHALLTEAAALPDDDLRAERERTLLSFTTTRALKELVTLASLEPELLASPTIFDTHPFLLTVNNGTIDLHTGQLQPHDPQHFITRLIPLDYDPDATSPLWLSFLDQVTSHDPQLQHFLQSAVGYSLTGSTREDAFFVLQGPGHNGKQTFLDTIRFISGDYASHTNLSTFIPTRSGRSLAALSPLLASRLVTIPDFEPDLPLSVSLSRSLTAAEPLSARSTRLHPFTFQPHFKLWFAADQLPHLTTYSSTLWLRVKVIPFTASLFGHTNPALAQHLQANASAILTWAIQGCLHWLQEGLPFPDCVVRASFDYQSTEDILADFFFDACELDSQRQVSAHELYDAYLTWCRKNHEQPLTRNKFGRELLARDYRRVRDISGILYCGIALAAPPPPPLSSLPTSATLEFLERLRPTLAQFNRIIHSSSPLPTFAPDPAQPDLREASAGNFSSEGSAGNHPLEGSAGNFSLHPFATDPAQSDRHVASAGNFSSGDPVSPPDPSSLPPSPSIVHPTSSNNGENV